MPLILKHVASDNARTSIWSIRILPLHLCKTRVKFCLFLRMPYTFSDVHGYIWLVAFSGDLVLSRRSNFWNKTSVLDQISTQFYLRTYPVPAQVNLNHASLSLAVTFFSLFVDRINT